MPITDDVWFGAANRGSRARQLGLSIPASDLLIFACADKYGMAMEHFDRHDDLLQPMK